MSAVWGKPRLPLSALGSQIDKCSLWLEQGDVVFLFYYGSSACVQDVSVGNIRRVPCSTCKRKMQSLGQRGCLVFCPELRFYFKNTLAEELPCCGETLRKEETQPAFFQARWASSVAFRELWDYRKVARDKTGFVLGEGQAEFELVGSPTGFHILSIAETCPCSVGSAAPSLVKGPPSCVHSSSASNFCPFVFVFKIPSFQNVCYSAGLLESPHSCLGKLFFPFQFLFCRCLGNVSLLGLVGANVLWSFFCYPWVLPMSLLLYRVGCTPGKMRRVSSSMVLFSGRTYYKAGKCLEGM